MPNPIPPGKISIPPIFPNSPVVGTSSAPTGMFGQPNTEVGFGLYTRLLSCRNSNEDDD